MTTSATIAYLDFGLELADMLTAWRAVKAKTDAEGREVTLNDVKTLHALFAPTFARFDATVARADEGSAPST